MKQSGHVKAIALVGAGVILALLGLSFLSPVQTAFARHVLSSQPGLTADLDRIKVRPGSVEISELTLTRGPVQVRVPSARAELSLGSLLMLSPHVQRLEARGWEVAWDGDAPEMASGLEPSVVSAGWGGIRASVEPGADDSGAILDTISALLAAPLPVTLGEVDLVGTTRWKKAGPGVDGSADVRISGRGPEAGAEQTLQIDVAAVGDRAMAQGIEGLDIVAEVKTRLQDDATLAMAELRHTLTARLREDGIERQYGLDLLLDQTTGTPKVELVWRERDNELFQAELADQGADSGLTGAWVAAVDSTHLSHLMLGRGLPQFSLRGQGQIVATRELDDISLAGTVEALMGDLSVIKPELGGLGELTTQVDFAVRQAGADTRITELVISATGAAPVAQARLLQGVELGRDAYELRVESPHDPVWELDLQGIPLAWLQPWLAPWVLDAKPLAGKLLGLVTPQGLRVITSEPLRLDEFALAEAGNTLIDRGEIEIEMGAEVTTAGWQVELGRVSIAREGQESITLQARGGRLQDDAGVTKLVGRLEADIAAAAQWPGLTDLMELTSGRMTAEFGVGLSERLSIATALSIDDLNGPRSEGALPTLEADARLDVLADGVIELHLPAVISQGVQHSDITLNLRAEPQMGGWNFESSVSGSEIHIADLQALLAVLSADENVVQWSDQETATLRPVQVQPAVPFWRDLTGTVQTNFGQVLMDDAPAITRFTGQVEISTDQVTLPQVSAQIGTEGNLLATGSLTHRAEGTSHYEGRGNISLTDVAIDPWLRWFDPTQVPVMSGRVNLDATWQAAVEQLSDLPSAGELSAQLTSSGGEIRALGVEIENYIQTGQTVAALGALLGSFTGNEEIQQQAGRMQSAADAAAALSLVAFDQLSLNLDRAVNGDIILSDLSLISPSLRLLGEGRITYRPNLAFWLQPLEITLNLSARDQLGAALQQLGLLNSEADSLGYLPLISSFTLDGSLARIGTTELQDLITRRLLRP